MNSAPAFLAGAVVGVASGAAAARAIQRRKTERLARLLSFALHELNTPLTAANMTMVNLLSDVFGELPRPLRPWAEIAREQLNRLACVVGEFRDFVHMEFEGSARVALITINASEMCGDALVSIRRAMEQAGVEFQVEQTDNLPAIRTDPDRFMRCLSSALFHARKFRNGGVIRMEVAHLLESVVFTVTYQGPRLSPAEVEASLDLYYPARQRKDHVLGSTGLGLGFIRHVMRQIGGEFELISEGNGLTSAIFKCPVSSGDK